MSSTTDTFKQNTLPIALPATPKVPGDTTSEKERNDLSPTPLTFRRRWIDAFKHTWPIYLASHIVFLLLTYLATLFSIDNFSTKTLKLNSLVNAWNRWDTGHFTFIANHGYDASWRTAFFPFYPMLEHGLSYLVQDSFVAGLIISNIATLLLFMAIYRLITDDFNAQTANRTVLYMAIFPSAFFLVSAYNESLFILLTLMSFYSMRRRKWWLAGLFGFFASLTRSAGILLVIPFCYEYLRQYDFNIRKIRLDSISIVLIPMSVAVFSIYCYIKFNDALAFSHAQAVWGRTLSLPFMTFVSALKILHHNSLLSFSSIHTAIDLSSALFMLALVILCFVGPWKFVRAHWSYAFYTSILYIFLITFPSPTAPVQSLTRQVIELFPAFIILARMSSKYSKLEFYYLSISGALLCFLLLQFLTGYWIV